MNRRLFLSVVGCFAGVLSFGVKPSPVIGGNVRLVRYVDPSFVGSEFKIVEGIAKPQNANQHYRQGEQLYRIVGNGWQLDVYADEIVAI